MRHAAAYRQVVDQNVFGIAEVDHRVGIVVRDGLLLVRRLPGIGQNEARLRGVADPAVGTPFRRDFQMAVEVAFVEHDGPCDRHGALPGAEGAAAPRQELSLRVAQFELIGAILLQMDDTAAVLLPVAVVNGRNPGTPSGGINRSEKRSNRAGRLAAPVIGASAEEWHQPQRDLPRRKREIETKKQEEC